MNNMPNSAQGAFMGAQAPQGFAPMMFDPSKYQNPFQQPPGFQPTPQQQQPQEQQPVAAAVEPELQQPQARPETLGYQPGVQPEPQDYQNPHPQHDPQQQHQQQNYDQYYQHQYDQQHQQHQQNQDYNNYWDSYNYNYDQNQQYNQWYQYQQQQGQDQLPEQQHNGHVQQPDLVAAAPPEAAEQVPNAPTPEVNTGPDVIANHEEAEEAVEAAAVAEPVGSGSHYYQQQLEHQQFEYQQHPAPDILNTEEQRNRHIFNEQQGERQPVDGGNEQVNNLPMHRLVLGDEQEQRNEAIEDVQRSETIGSAAPPPLAMPPQNEERSEAAGAMEPILPPPMAAPLPMVAPLSTVAPPPLMMMPPPAMQNSEERSETIGATNSLEQNERSETIGAVIPPPPSVMSMSEERSEAAGAVNIPPPPMGVIAPPPLSTIAPPPMVNQQSEERSEAIGAVIAPPPMMMPAVMQVPPEQRSEAIGAHVTPAIPLVDEQRIEAIGAVNSIPPPPMNTPVPPPPVQNTERSQAIGAVNPIPTLAPTDHTRSEAIGAVTPPPPIQVQVPLPMQTSEGRTLTPTASEERSEAAGSDRRDIPANPAVAPIPPPPAGRNVTGADNRKARKKPEYSEDEDETSVISKESDKRRPSNRNRRTSPEYRRRDRRRSPTPPSRSSSPISEDSYRQRGGDQRRDQRRDHRYDQRSSKRNDHKRSNRYHNDTRSYRDNDRSYRDHERSYRDPDRSYREPSYNDSRHHYYDDRRSERGSNRRPHQDSYSSRPSSRQGYYHPEYSYYAAPAPYAPVAAPAAVPPPMPDANTLEIFRRNWEFYTRNPTEMEKLRISQPAKHQNLLNYYHHYNQFLPQITENRPLSRTNSVNNVSSISQQFPRTDQSTILHPDGLEQSANYQPTPEVSKVEEEISEMTKDEPERLFTETPAERLTPMKFVSPHIKGIFGPVKGILKIKAKSPKDGQTASLEIHSIKAIMSRQPGFKELHGFPGPLVPGATHKGEVIQFCQNKIKEIQKSQVKIIDKDSQILMWDLMILLLRQKNTIDGSDIAELLLKNRDIHRPYKDFKVNNNDMKEDISNNGSLSEVEQETDEDFVKVTTSRTILTPQEEMDKHTSKFRDYLLFGHKKEGLEYAMSHGLWGHALFLASKMDERSYSQVMLRFANGLKVNDPLQTLYQLMSGRQPIAVKECADANWGDWRPHLAMILSNHGSQAEGLKSITTLGDTLNERGFLWASQFCYLMANKEFGHYENSSSKIVLLGADKSLPFAEFASNEAIQLTEIFEYVQKLSNPDHIQHSFLHYKYLYAVRLLDFGLTGQALHYLEELALAVTKDPNAVDQEFKPYLNQIYNLADKLKFLDPMYTTREGEISEMGDPDWLTLFQKALENMQYDHNSSESNITAPAVSVMESQWFQDDHGRYYYYDAATGSYQYPAAEEQQVDQAAPPKEPDTPVHEESTPVETPTSEATEDPPIMMTPQAESRRESESAPAAVAPLMMPPTSVPSIPSMPSPPMMQEKTPPPMIPTISAPTPSLPTPPPVSQPGPNYFADMKTEAAPKPAPVKAPTKAPAPKKKAEQQKSSAPPKSGFFSSILGKIGVLPPNQAHLPDESENTIVWDEEKKRWVDKNATEDEDVNASSAPPSDMELSRSNSTANFDSVAAPPGGAAAPPPPMMMGQNKFAGGLSKKRGAGARIDVFKNSQSSPALSNNLPPPSELFAPMAPITPAMTPEESNDAPVAPATTAAAGPSAPSTPLDGPVFFNPNAIAAAPAPSTRRNKYA